MSPLELYLVLSSVFIQIHGYMEQFCFCFLARSCLSLNILWEDLARKGENHTCHDGRQKEGLDHFLTDSYKVFEVQCPIYFTEMEDVLILLLLLQSLFKPLRIATTVVQVPWRKQDVGSSVFVKAVCDWHQGTCGTHMCEQNAWAWGQPGQGKQDVDG